MHYFQPRNYQLINQCYELDLHLVGLLLAKLQNCQLQIFFSVQPTDKNLISPAFFIAYLQVEVDIDAGLYFAGAIMIFSSLILSPSAIISLRTPKIYTAEESVVSDKLYQTSYIPRPL